MANIPSEEMAILVGKRNKELVPIPFCIPEEISPAKVVTEAVEISILRIK
jgi:hypothetical protein